MEKLDPTYCDKGIALIKSGIRNEVYVILTKRENFKKFNKIGIYL